MRQILTLLLVSLSLFAKAQNYRCYNPSTKRFYLNDRHYLKGMRIDSVRTLGTDTIYYPFHSYRGKHFLDTLGASWLGKTMTIKPDGSTLLINQTNDTIVILTQAKLYDNWTFYKDASANYYEATVINIDTVTVLGVIDSVKWININSYNATGINTTDTLNNTMIGLSKDHGMIQCLDLGIFPSLSDDYLLNAFTGLSPTKGNLTFKLIDFINPDYLDFYDYNINDAFLSQSVVNNDYSHSTQSLLKILAKDASVPGYMSYDIDGWGRSNFPNRPPTTSWYRNTLKFNSGKFIDTLYMPEEWHSQRFYFYNPDDSSFCIKGLYTYVGNSIMYPAPEINDFEPGYAEARYKNGLGQIYWEQDVPSGNSYHVTNLMSVYKGYPCGSMPYLSIENAAAKASVIYPNPATDKLYIENSNSQITAATLLSSTGQIIKSIQVDKAAEIMDISEIPAGIYLLKITDTTGGVAQQKVTILK